MDAVILAAGKGMRLAGIAAPYYKPLLPVNGVPIVVDLVQKVQSVLRGEGDRVVVVVAPENCLPMAQLFRAHNLFEVDVVVQTVALGPGHALERGLRICSSQQVLVIMGDNVMNREDIALVVNQSETSLNVVGVADLDFHDIDRFTRFRETGEWVEKVPASDEDKNALAWVGPFVTERIVMQDVLWRHHIAHPSKEVPIGPYFNLLRDIATVHVNAVDIGTPENWE